MNLGLKESVALVTGSSSGIGKAAAIAFGGEGARVAVTYHSNRQGAEETASQVRDAGAQALVTHYDLADPDSVRSSIQALEKEWGMLNVLVNNAAPMQAAGPSRQLFEDVPLQNWEAMLRNTLEGVTLTIQCALPLLRKSGWGRIVNVSSDATDGWPGLGPYATAKAGLHGLTRTLAVELGSANILSNVVMPGAVMTERTQQHTSDEQREQIKQLSYVGLRVLMPAVLVVLVSGIWLVLTISAFSFTQLWVLLALGAFVVAFLIGAVYQSRSAIQLERLATGPDPDPVATRELLNRWIVGYQIILIILIFAVWDMVFKPGL